MNFSSKFELRLLLDFELKFPLDFTLDLLLDFKPDLLWILGWVLHWPFLIEVIPNIELEHSLDFDSCPIYVEILVGGFVKLGIGSDFAC